MATLKIIFAVLALAMVAYHGAAAFRFHKVCMELEKALETEFGPKPEAREAMHFAAKWLRDRGTIKHGYAENKLASAWEKVVGGAECESQSMDIVEMVAKCKPGMASVWDGLKAATKQYANKCLTRDYFKAKIDAAKKGCSTSGCFGLSRSPQEFLSEEFLRDFRQENPDDRHIHFAVIYGENCCKPNTALETTLRAMERDTRTSARTKFADNRAAFDKYLEKHLFEPCQRYNKGLDNVMDSMFEASEFYLEKDDELDQKLHPDSQDDVFRYKFCTDFEHKSLREEFASKLYVYMMESS